MRWNLFASENFWLNFSEPGVFLGLTPGGLLEFFSGAYNRYEPEFYSRKEGESHLRWRSMKSTTNGHDRSAVCAW